MLSIIGASRRGAPEMIGCNESERLCYIQQIAPEELCQQLVGGGMLPPKGKSPTGLNHSGWRGSVKHVNLHEIPYVSGDGMQRCAWKRGALIAEMRRGNRINCLFKTVHIRAARRVGGIQTNYKLWCKMREKWEL